MKYKKLLILFYTFLSLSNVNLNRSLIIAISKGDFLRVKKLVESGANVNYAYHKGKSALHWAATSGNPKIVAYLIYKGAKIDSTDINGSTPLQLSALGKDLDTVKLLVQNGADVEHKDKNGWTPLHYFVFYEFEIGVKYLLTQGVSLTNKTRKKFMEIPENSTPLDIAIKKNYPDIVNILENPIKYTSLAQKAILTFNINFNFGEDNSISPLESGFIQLCITNLGGLEISNLRIELKSISNTEDLEFETSKSINLQPGETKEVNFLCKGLATIEKSGKGFFEMSIYGEKSTNIIPFTIEKVFIPLPSPYISATFQYPFEILTGNSTNLTFKLKNIGKGVIEKGVFKVSFLSSNIVNNLNEFSNINLTPSEYTNITVSINTIENENIIEPETVKTKIIFGSVVEITNVFNFKIIPLQFPEFYSDYGKSESPFTNIFINNEPPSIEIFISNITEIEGKNLYFNIKSLPVETNINFNIHKFPAHGVLNLALPSFFPEENHTLIIEIYYKKRLLFNKSYSLTNGNHIDENISNIEE